MAKASRFMAAAAGQPARGDGGVRRRSGPGQGPGACPAGGRLATARPLCRNRAGRLGSFRCFPGELLLPSLQGAFNEVSIHRLRVSWQGGSGLLFGLQTALHRQLLKGFQHAPRTFACCSSPLAHDGGASLFAGSAVPECIERHRASLNQGWTNTHEPSVSRLAFAPPGVVPAPGAAPPSGVGAASQLRTGGRHHQRGHGHGPRLERWPAHSGRCIRRVWGSGPIRTGIVF